MSVISPAEREHHWGTESLMLMVYSSSSIADELEDELSTALEKDCARIAYATTDGTESFVIVEARDFRNTRAWERSTGQKILCHLPVRNKKRRVMRLKGHKQQ
ncbi:MAG: hypothetical protein HYU64_02710 [Armatimonadetes bacterium]|nr:hypothetical protein [Armatimonadota bacterium]